MQVLQQRLTQLRHAATVLAVPATPQPITPTHVPSLSPSLSYAPPKGAGWSESSDFYYRRALALCEKMFEGALDQPAYEEALRRVMATNGYLLFTVDRTLTSILKLVRDMSAFSASVALRLTEIPYQSLTAVTDAKTRELFGLLQEDRSHPDRSTHSQQIAYRTQAEAILGPDENLYRVEFSPADERDAGTSDALLGFLRFQLVGKDIIGPEDLGAAERDWAEYVANYVRLERTPGLVVEPHVPYLPRNLRQLGIPPPKTVAAAADVRPAVPKGLEIKSGLQSKICLRSYKLFFCAESEDVLHRQVRTLRSEDDERDVQTKKAARVARWLEKRRQALEAQPAGGEDQPMTDDAEAKAATTAAEPVKEEARTSEGESADKTGEPKQEDSEAKGGDVEMAS